MKTPDVPVPTYTDEFAQSGDWGWIVVEFPHRLWAAVGEIIPFCQVQEFFRSLDFG